MTIKNLKLELFYLRKSFFIYHRGWKYLMNKFFLALKIFQSDSSFEKPITSNDFSIHILTSHKDLVIATWALASFYHFSNTIGDLYIHSDGSLTKNDFKVLNKLFPRAVIVDSKNFLKDYSAELDKHPILKEFRANNKNFSFKKIIDPFFISPKKFRLIIDSDILWFKDFVEVQQVLSGHDTSSYMQNNGEAFEVIFKDGTKLARDLSYANAGIILYNRNNFDMDKLAEFLTKLDKNNHKSLHFADQYGYAYCLKNLKFLDVNKYSLKKEVTIDVVARHYTSPRRPLFFIEGLEYLKNIILK